MRAVQLIDPGMPLEDRQLPRPRPGSGDVVVEVAAAGICRSDLHYRAGFPPVSSRPLTLGHEAAGHIAAVGSEVAGLRIGDRVCVHYLVGCGRCPYCARGFEQFCPEGQMVGKDRAGGYAEAIVVPARNVVAVPDAIPLEHAAVMMCSSATSLHALRKGRLAGGETVAIFGVGGLGMSAVQLAMIEGAARVYAVDFNPSKLERAAACGATPLDAGDDPLAALRAAGGVDVALDLVGSGAVMRQCLDALAPMGRAVAVGLTPDAFPVGPYPDLVIGESELIGTSDHLLGDIRDLLDYAATGRLRLDDIVDETVPLTADSINGALDALEGFGNTIRTVVIP